ncbi:hypothetical protein H7F33_13965 [Pedobacter sp. PAMC26386]|nr:hypothetical protein H7F33_13965 [Pedobacter sp. PAMC26386]
MTTASYYRNGHQVMMTLRSSSYLSSLYLLSLNKHAEYYRQQIGKLISYGYCMNQDAICIVLKVACSNDFEHIISNDPQLISGALEIDVIIPFRSL